MTDTPTSTDHARLSGGVIGGIVAGSAVVLWLVGLTAILFFRRKTSISDNSNDIANHSFEKPDRYAVPSRGINQVDPSNWDPDYAGGEIPSARLGGNMDSPRVGHPEGFDKELGGRVKGVQ